MRGSFVSTCDLYAGPGAIAPGLYATAVPCRIVTEDGITPIGTGSPAIPAYLICDAELPVGAWMTGVSYGSDPSLADQVAVPTGSAVSYWVVYVDKIDWLGQPVYYRAYLSPLPPPTVAPVSTNYWLDTFTDTGSVSLASHVGENTPGGYTVLGGSLADDGAGMEVMTFSSSVCYFSFDPAASNYRAVLRWFIPFNTATRILFYDFRVDFTNGNWWQVQIPFSGSSHQSGAILLYRYDSSTPTLVNSSSYTAGDFEGNIVLDDDGTNIIVECSGRRVVASSTTYAGNTVHAIGGVDTGNSTGWTLDYLSVDPLP